MVRLFSAFHLSFLLAITSVSSLLSRFCFDVPTAEYYLFTFISCIPTSLFELFPLTIVTSFIFHYNCNYVYFILSIHRIIILIIILIH